jgi:hypothetical protein
MLLDVLTVLKEHASCIHILLDEWVEITVRLCSRLASLEYGSSNARRSAPLQGNYGKYTTGLLTRHTTHDAQYFTHSWNEQNGLPMGSWSLNCVRFGLEPLKLSIRAGLDQLRISSCAVPAEGDT